MAKIECRLASHSQRFAAQNGPDFDYKMAFAARQNYMHPITYHT